MARAALGASCLWLVGRCLDGASDEEEDVCVLGQELLVEKQRHERQRRVLGEGDSVVQEVGGAVLDAVVDAQHALALCVRVRCGRDANCKECHLKLNKTPSLGHFI